MSWPEDQQLFVAALKDPEKPVPESLGQTSQSEPSLKRFNVYRNNVSISLIEVLADTFPVVQQLVGEAFFKAMANIFVSQHLPSSPVLLHYGETFPDFVRDFEPAKSSPFLPDVARLEWAWCQSYHAKDSQPLSLEAIAALSEDQLGEVTFHFHPSFWLIQSAWPIFSIWQAHQQEHPETALKSLKQGDEYGFIVRPVLDVILHPITKDLCDFIASLKQGRPLNEAATLFDTKDPSQLSAGLQLLFESGAIIRLQ
ncbi:MAG: DNA-binding domain-containing protein [Pseudomonadota bacterium]